MTDEKKAARQGGSDQYTHVHFSSAAHRGKAPFDLISEAIAGQEEGRGFVRDLADGASVPDALFMRLRQIAGNAAKMRGFCRAVQKFVERASA